MSNTVPFQKNKSAVVTSPLEFIDMAECSALLRLSPRRIGELVDTEGLPRCGNKRKGMRVLFIRSAVEKWAINRGQTGYARRPTSKRPNRERCAQMAGEPTVPSEDYQRSGCIDAGVLVPTVNTKETAPPTCQSQQGHNHQTEGM